MPQSRIRRAKCLVDVFLPKQPLIDNWLLTHFPDAGALGIRLPGPEAFWGKTSLVGTVWAQSAQGS